MLEEHGYDVLTAHDGSEGLRRAECDSPDLLVLDAMMPRRSGLRVLEHSRPRGRPRPLPGVVSANEGARHEQLARDKGADAYLKKPFDMSDLLAAVDALLKA